LQAHGLDSIRRRGPGAAIGGNMEHILLTKTEVADMLHVSVDTVMRWVRRGVMPKPAIHKTNIVRFHAETIRAWASENCPHVARHGWRAGR